MCYVREMEVIVMILTKTEKTALEMFKEKFTNPWDVFYGVEIPLSQKQFNFLGDSLANIPTGTKVLEVTGPNSIVSIKKIYTSEWQEITNGFNDKFYTLIFLTEYPQDNKSYVKISVVLAKVKPTKMTDIYLVDKSETAFLMDSTHYL